MRVSISTLIPYYSGPIAYFFVQISTFTPLGGSWRGKRDSRASPLSSTEDRTHVSSIVTTQLLSPSIDSSLAPFSLALLPSRTTVLASHFNTTRSEFNQTTMYDEEIERTQRSLLQICSCFAIRFCVLAGNARATAAAEEHAVSDSVCVCVRCASVCERVCVCSSGCCQADKLTKLLD